MKTCTCCGETKELTAFPKHRQKPDGLYNYCKLCKKVKDKESYENHKDTRYAKTREYVTKNPEKVRAYKKKHRDKPEAKEKSEQRRKLPENIEKARKRNSAWKKNNKPKVNANTRFRQARLLNATPAWADRESMESKYRLARFFTDLSGGFVEYHVDHIVPLRGKTVCGLHVESNLQVLRADINFSKNAKFTGD